MTEKQNSELSTIAQLFIEIQKRAQEISINSENRVGIDSLFVQAIALAMDEIRRGADAEEFQDLAVLNLLSKAYEEGYAPEEIRGFVASLKAER